jgi:DNA-binding XRE family transcriptional regulator
VYLLTGSPIWAMVDLPWADLLCGLHSCPTMYSIHIIATCRASSVGACTLQVAPRGSDPAMRDWRLILGKNVRRLRKQKGLTQEQLAFEAEIDLTYIGGIERGKRNPSLLVMSRIADALSVPLPKLLID